MSLPEESSQKHRSNDAAPTPQACKFGPHTKATPSASTEEETICEEEKAATAWVGSHGRTLLLLHVFGLSLWGVSSLLSYREEHSSALIELTGIITLSAFVVLS